MTEPLRTTVRVENHNFSDVDLFVVRSGGRIRLGTVTGLTTEVFTIPQGVVEVSGDLQFLASPVGGRGGALSMSIPASPGDSLVLEIPSGPL